MESMGQGNDFKLIRTVKMETNPIAASFGNEFLSIYNRCVVQAAWSRKWLNFLRNFCVVWKNDHLTVKFLKFCSERIHRLTDRHVVCKFREIWPTGSRWNRALLTWPKTSPALPLSLLGGSRPKSDNVLGVLQISSKSDHFRRSYTRTRWHRQNAT